MKERADKVLYHEGYFDSIKLAQSFIMQGLVLLDNVPIDKAGEKIKYNSNIRIKGEQSKYVSRGGKKLEKAIDLYKIQLANKVAMDIGASTGGFTDCMLQNGASQVYAVDVGYGQLDWKLRNDPRVVVMERTNIRNVTGEDLTAPLDFVTCDASFISLELILPIAHSLLKDQGEGVMLIKPQFEAEKSEVGAKGVVRNKEVHRKVLKKMIDLIDDNKLYIKGLTHSPITGPEGNIEFLLYVSKNDLDHHILEDADIEAIVEAAHGAFY